MSSILPDKEEQLSYRNEVLLKLIDQQLEGVKIDVVQSKRALMEQKSIEAIQRALQDKVFTYEELVAYYLMNIRALDQSQAGNNAVSEINPNAIKQARMYDNMPCHHLPLQGIPVLIKENINTKDMPTSAGTDALKDFIPEHDATIVDLLRANGAIILGKTNLSELSYWMDERCPSGYSAKKGQTTNPFYPLVISPLGSSSGSAVAMATDLATVAIGTETLGSIVAPASVNSVVGYKPTRHYIDGEGIIPITYALDTAGPIAKTVRDAYLTYNAMTQYPLAGIFDEQYLAGKRIGIRQSDDLFFKDMSETLLKCGAVVVPIVLEEHEIDVMHILMNHFERDFNHYLLRYKAPIQSLSELVVFNRQNKKVRMRYGQNLLEQSLLFKDYCDEKVTEMIRRAQRLLNDVMDMNQLDAVVTQDNYGIVIPAVAGAPEISVPFGKYEHSPVGATFFGRIAQDVHLLKIAYSFEQLTALRLIPNKQPM